VRYTARPLVEAILRDQSLTTRERDQSLQEAQNKVLERLRSKGFIRMQVGPSSRSRTRDLRYRSPWGYWACALPPREL
jgi:hypothetical protein